jgi:hypothetical protein
MELRRPLGPASIGL